MNLILLSSSDRETDSKSRFTLRDARATHAFAVLHARVGDSLVVGLREGPHGRAVVVAIDESSLELEVEFESVALARPRIDLVIAMPRPKAWKRLLPQIAQFEVDRVVVVNAARVEKPYFSTQYLEREHYTPLLEEGLMQAKRTRVPSISIEPLFRPFVEDRLDAWLGPSRRIVLDPVTDGSLEAAIRSMDRDARVAVAIGPDTGFVPFEIDRLMNVGFVRARLGTSILRTDTAAVAALGAITAWCPGVSP